MPEKVHTRKAAKSETRQIKRIRLSIDTLLREALDLPVPTYLEPQPVSTLECIAFLEGVVRSEPAQSNPHKVMSPTLAR